MLTPAAQIDQGSCLEDPVSSTSVQIHFQNILHSVCLFLFLSSFTLFGSIGKTFYLG